MSALIFVKDAAVSASVILSSTGAPVTGLTFADVTSYVSKNGASPLAFTLDGTNFQEIDAVNMPGVYHVTVPASLTDTLGELILSFSGGTFDTYLIRANVVDGAFNELNTFAEDTNTVVNANQVLLNTVDSTTTAIQSDILGFSTSISNVLAELSALQGASFDGATDSVEAIRDLLDARMPSEVALRSHLVDGSGNITPPADVGLWDVLGDGTASISDLSLDMKRVLGLSQENYKITSQTYDSNDNLISAIIEIYPSKADLEADTNVLATYVISAAYDTSNRLVSYQVVKQP